MKITGTRARIPESFVSGRVRRHPVSRGGAWTQDTVKRLGPARGILTGILLGLAVWLGIIAVALAWWL